jgi:hypothetical protein
MGCYVERQGLRKKDGKPRIETGVIARDGQEKMVLCRGCLFLYCMTRAVRLLKQHYKKKMQKNYGVEVALINRTDKKKNL